MKPKITDKRKLANHVRQISHSSRKRCFKIYRYSPNDAQTQILRARPVVPSGKHCHFSKRQLRSTVLI